MGVCEERCGGLGWDNGVAGYFIDIGCVVEIGWQQQHKVLGSSNQSDMGLLTHLFHIITIFIIVVIII